MNYSNGLSHLQGKLLKNILVWMKCPTQVCEVRTCIRMSGLITVPIHQCLPHPWISGVLDSWPWKQMILLALIITQSTNPSSSSACSAHPMDTCSWCTMLQRWGNICSHGFCKEGKYQLKHNVHGSMGSSPGTTLKQVFQSPPHVTLPCKAGNAETKASSVISISEKTELTLPGKQNLSFLLNSLSAYLLGLSKLDWNIIKGGSCGLFIKSSRSTYFPGKDNPKRIDWGNTHLKRDSAPPRLSVYYGGGGIAIRWCPPGSF